MFWKEIHIISPKVTHKTKDIIKKAISNIITKEEVQQYIEKQYDGFKVKNICIDKCKVITIEIITDYKECQICFTQCVDKQMCTTCKESNTCRSCEDKQKQRFNRCAFCNGSF